MTLDDKVLRREIARIASGSLKMIVGSFRHIDILSSKKFEDIKELEIHYMIELYRYESGESYMINTNFRAENQSGWLFNGHKCFNDPNNHKTQIALMKIGWEFNADRLENNHPLKYYSGIKIIGMIDRLIPEYLEKNIPKYLKRIGVMPKKFRFRYDRDVVITKQKRKK